MTDAVFEDGYEGFDDEPADCPTCHGTGIVNPLTNPDWAPFIASYGTCPSCDGSGEMP